MWYWLPQLPLSGFRLVSLPGSMILPSKAASVGGLLGDWLHQEHWVKTSLNWFGAGKTTCPGTPEPPSPSGSTPDVLLPLVVAKSHKKHASSSPPYHVTQKLKAGSYS